VHLGTYTSMGKNWNSKIIVLWALSCHYCVVHLLMHAFLAIKNKKWSNKYYGTKT